MGVWIGIGVACLVFIIAMAIGFPLAYRYWHGRRKG
jgi:hypothetical protein